MDELISLRLPSELLEKIDAEAKTERRSRAFIMREAMEKFFVTDGNKQPKKPVKKAGAR